jgi:hypothetical protein
MASAPLACVAALIGFRNPLPTRGAGILQRSGVHVVTFARPEEALRVLTTELTVAVAVLDLSNALVRALAPSFLEWLRGVRPPAATRVVVACDRALGADLREGFAAAGGTLVPRSHLSYRRLAFVLRELTALPTSNHPSVLRLSSLRRRGR